MRRMAGAGMSGNYHYRGGYMAKKLTTLYLDLELIERLNKLSAETRVPRAVYIRDAIDLVLKKYEKAIQEG